MKNLLLLTGLGVLYAFQGLAQGEIKLNEASVSASRIPTERPYTGRSVEVITSTDIAEMPVQSMDELLRYVAGVNLNTRAAFGAQADIGIRGSTFSQVLVVVDNLRLNDPLTGHFNAYIPVPLSEIERIEIIRGAAVASYGADAVGGVIHIYTKTYAGTEVAGSTQGEVALGEYGLRQIDAGVILGRDRFRLSAATQAIRADGEERLNPNFGQVSDTDSLFLPYADLSTHTLSAAFLASDRLRFFARVGYDERDFNAKYFYTRSIFDESVEQVQNLWSQFSVIYRPGRHRVEVQLGHKELKDVFTFNPLFTPNSHQTRQQIIYATHRLPQVRGWAVQHGFQYLNRSIESSDRGSHELGNLAWFAETHGRLIGQLRATLSLRLESDDNFGFEVLPQAALSHLLGRFVLRSSYAKSVRGGDFTERFVSYNITNLSPGRNLGNPDLAAEEAHSLDLGADYFSECGFRASATAFYRTSTNLIDFNLTNADDIAFNDNLQPGEDYFFASNLSSTEVIGLEASLEHRVQISESTRLEATLAYTYLSTSTPETELSKYISNHPQHNLSAVTALVWREFRVQLAANAIERNPELADEVSGSIRRHYLTVHGRLSWNVSQGGRLFVEAYNLGDVRIQEILGAQMPGRWLSAGVTWNIPQ